MPILVGATWDCLNEPHAGARPTAARGLQLCKPWKMNGVRSERPDGEWFRKAA
jgi:hypothetical protein